MWSTLFVYGLLGPLEAGRLVSSTAFGVSHAHVLCLAHNCVLHWLRLVFNFEFLNDADNWSTSFRVLCVLICNRHYSFQMLSFQELYCDSKWPIIQPYYRVFCATETPEYTVLRCMVGVGLLGSFGFGFGLVEPLRAETTIPNAEHVKETNLQSFCLGPTILQAALLWKTPICQLKTNSIIPKAIGYSICARLLIISWLSFTTVPRHWLLCCAMTLFFHNSTYPCHDNCQCQCLKALEFCTFQLWQWNSILCLEPQQSNTPAKKIV